MNSSSTEEQVSSGPSEESVDTEQSASSSNNYISPEPSLVEIVTVVESSPARVNESSSVYVWQTLSFEMKILIVGFSALVLAQGLVLLLIIHLHKDILGEFKI